MKLEISLRACQFVQIEPSVSLLINGEVITVRQLEVLVAVNEEGSQNRAAERLGISTPVLHRYLKKLESRADAPMITTSPTGTELTREGRAVVREFMALKGRTRSGESITVGCTIITEELLLSALSNMDSEGVYDLIISDDERNLKDFKAGLMDIVVLDDPLYAYEFEDARWEEIAYDHLMHFHMGRSYLRFKYGAQRIGFRPLESQCEPFSITGTTRSLSNLIRSGLSFFINQSYASRKGVDIRSRTPPHLLGHKIYTLFSEQSAEVDRLVAEMRRGKL